jgi:hypothetical protein
MATMVRLVEQQLIFYFLNGMILLWQLCSEDLIEYKLNTLH